MLDPGLLRLLALVEDTGSLAGAADLLGITPAGVTAQVARLERTIGAPVIRRGPRGATLEPLGRALLADARAIEQAVASAERAVDEFSGRAARRLRVGAFTTAAFRLVAPALTALRNRHDDLDLEVVEILSIDGPRLVRDDELDIAVVSVFDETLVVDAALTVEPIHVDPLVVVLPENHRLAGRSTRRSPMSLTALADEAWVAILAGADARAQFDRLAREAGITPDIRFETTSYEVAQALVGAGIAVALVAELAVRGVDGTVTRRVEGDRAHRTIEAIVRRERTLTPLVDEFVALTRDVARD